jgi:hypothetical protein
MWCIHTLTRRLDVERVDLMHASTLDALQRRFGDAE